MHARLFAALCVFFIGGVLSAPYQNETKEEPKKNYRLDGTLTPTNYKITLTPYILETKPSEKRFTFDGEVRITLKETEKDTRKEIILHQKGLTISQKKLNKKGEAQEIVITDAKLDDVTDKFTLQLEKPLVKGQEYELYFKYTGKLSDDMKGFYKSYYKDEEGNNVWLASTQFQTHHARRAFPCFDEPRFKATFDIEIIRSKELKAISNTEIKETQKIDDKRTREIFYTTPEMSTYLVAFLISDFKARSETTGRKFSVLARPGAYDQTEYSFNTGKAILDKFDEYFKIPYKTLGIEKMDLAAIPDFSAGAMENWGLLTFRERALLYDSSTTTAISQQSIAAVVAHEQAHMWFGDYVTCDWWSYTWLNEGFARYFQYFMLAKVNNDWDLEKQFVVDQIHSVFVMDSLDDTHPMSDLSAETPADLARMFGSISYNKGASVIRMIHHAMGEDRFKDALKSYLTKNKKQTVVPDKLFDELISKWKGDHTDFKQFLKDFTEQVGYPLVTIKMKEDGNSFTVSQTRFLLKPVEGSQAALLYTIPFTYTTDKKLAFQDTKPSTFLSKSDKEIEIPLSAKSDFVIANIQQTGYYRVNYDEATWHKIHKFLDSDNFEQIHEINRAQIIDDLFNLARAKILNYDLVLDILEYLNRETSYLPWTAAFNGYANIAIRLAPENLQLFGKQITRITKKVYEKLTFSPAAGEKRLDTYNRAKVLSWACQYGSVDCRTKAKEHFKKLVNENTPVPVDIRQVVYCTALREGGDAEFNFLWGKYVNENVATEQVLILGTLGCTKSKDLVHKYIKSILSESVRLQDRSAALSSLYNENLQVVFEYVTQNYKDFITPFGGISEVASILSNIASRFTNDDQIKALKAFYDKNMEEFKDSGERIDKALRTAEENLKWTQELMPHFMEILKVKNSATVLKSFNIFIAVIISALTITLFH